MARDCLTITLWKKKWRGKKGKIHSTSNLTASEVYFYIDWEATSAAMAPLYFHHTQNKRIKAERAAGENLYFMSNSRSWFNDALYVWERERVSGESSLIPYYTCEIAFLLSLAKANIYFSLPQIFLLYTLTVGRENQASRKQLSHIFLATFHGEQ